MFNLLAANLHDGNSHDLTSSLGLIGNSILTSTQQDVTSSSRDREFSSSPGKKNFSYREKNSRLLTSLQITLKLPYLLCLQKWSLVVCGTWAKFRFTVVMLVYYLSASTSALYPFDHPHFTRGLESSGDHRQSSPELNLTASSRP